MQETVLETPKLKTNRKKTLLQQVFLHFVFSFGNAFWSLWNNLQYSFLYLKFLWETQLYTYHPFSKTKLYAYEVAHLVKLLFFLSIQICLIMFGTSPNFFLTSIYFFKCCSLQRVNFYYSWNNYSFEIFFHETIYFPLLGHWSLFWNFLSLS